LHVLLMLSENFKGLYEKTIDKYPDR